MRIEVSIGEVMDKITILTIKLEKFRSPEKRANVRRELESLSKTLEEAGLDTESDDFRELRRINLTLWDVEDALRRKESLKEFDEEFIRLARRVYFQNDRRAAVKRRVNLRHGSEIIEEKEYAQYADGTGEIEER